jgi:hypothetical protein
VSSAIKLRFVRNYQVSDDRRNDGVIKRTAAMKNLCKDCRKDCIPLPDRGDILPGSLEYYMVHDALWRQAGMSLKRGGFLCVACLEARLGRKLTPDDLTAAEINDPDPSDTPYLRAIKEARQVNKLWYGK